MVGAPLITVTPWSTDGLEAPTAGSKRSTSSTVAPATKLQPEHDVQPEDVEQRQHAEHHVVGALLAARVGLALLEVREQVAVGEHGGLRRAGGAAGEDQHREVVVAPVDAPAPARRPAGRRAGRRRRCRRPRLAMTCSSAGSRGAVELADGAPWPWGRRSRRGRRWRRARARSRAPGWWGSAGRPRARRRAPRGRTRRSTSCWRRRCRRGRRARGPSDVSPPAQTAPPAGAGRRRSWTCPGRSPRPRRRGGGR